tara:strand:+ start:294 stop:605 length:312 start_codon:yes stop_codon:yes gene_type:complete
MRGFYISVPDKRKADLIPIKRYNSLKKSNKEINPTWEELGVLLKGVHGGVISCSYKGVAFSVYELSASWLKGDFSALVSLGENKVAPNFTLFTSDELKDFNWD